VVAVAAALYLGTLLALGLRLRHYTIRSG
jgi:hypothetical protein